jgi:type I restriction enzyme S subunit
LKKETYNKLSHYTITTEDVYISIAGTIGLSGTIPPSLNNSILTENAAKITNLNNVDKHFLAYFLNSDLGRKQIMMQTGTTSQPKLALERIKALRIPLPPIPEQQKIAEILFTTDETIRNVNDQIVQYEYLKKGLIKTLLAKGIRHMKFKMTDIGEIPADWGICKFSEIAVTVKGSVPKDLSNNGVGINIYPYLSADYLRDDRKKTQYFNIDSRKTNKIVNMNEIILIWDGSNAGEFFIGKEGILSSTMVKLVFKDSSVIPKFIYFYMKLKENILKTTVKGSTIPHISEESLLNLDILLPPVTEQQKIAEILTTVDYKLELLSNKKTHLEKLKRGLMSDLLTGKVRVKINTLEREN